MNQEDSNHTGYMAQIIMIDQGPAAVLAIYPGAKAEKSLACGCLGVLWPLTWATTTLRTIRERISAYRVTKDKPKYGLYSKCFIPPKTGKINSQQVSWLCPPSTVQSYYYGFFLLPDGSSSF
jgi:hypothetical protein